MLDYMLGTSSACYDYFFTSSLFHYCTERKLRPTEGDKLQDILKSRGPSPGSVALASGS